jgi:hypothetical protein
LLLSWLYLLLGGPTHAVGVLSYLLLLAERAALWFHNAWVILNVHFAPLDLSILNHYLRTVLLVSRLSLVNIRLCSLGGADRLLMLSVVKTVGLPLFDLAARGLAVLIARNIVLIIFMGSPAVLVEHFAGTVDGTGNTIDLFVVWPPQAVVA